MTLTGRPHGKLLALALETRRRLADSDPVPSFSRMFQQLLRRFRPPPPSSEPLPLTDAERVRLDAVRSFTMTSPERQLALLDAVDYIVANRLPGDFVECGVWRGGCAMLAAARLIEHAEQGRGLHLFDTFEGMPPPSAADVQLDGRSAVALLAAEARTAESRLWAWASLDDVRTNLARTGYPEQNVHFVRGKVEDTLPAAAPARIALLRLDTDWYESTAHELRHLYDRVVPRGVVIIDDYGHWQGARRAMDEFLATLPFRPLLARTDYTGRMFVKP